jgi:DNA polymerase III epsilon subunit-like protein
MMRQIKYKLSTGFALKDTLLIQNYDVSVDNNKAIIKDNYIKIAESIVLSEESIAIHHITRTTLNNEGIHITDALKKFCKALKECNLVIGHNLSFDKRLIFVECMRNQVDQFFTEYLYSAQSRGISKKIKVSKPEYCTMRNNLQLCNITRLDKYDNPYLKFPSLTELYTCVYPKANLPQNMHNSLVDVIMTLMCYMTIEYGTDILKINKDIKKLLEN